MPRLPERAEIADDPVTEDRIERALVLTAYIVTRHGEVYAPLFDRLESELHAARRARAPAERARRVLEAYTVEGGVRAIL